jgi:hypothetical protein
MIDMAMEPQPTNIYVVRSVWRRLKKGGAVKIRRDLEPIKDVKAGGSGGVTDISKPSTGGKGSTGSR